MRVSAQEELESSASARETRKIEETYIVQPVSVRLHGIHTQRRHEAVHLLQLVVLESETPDSTERISCEIRPIEVQLRRRLLTQLCRRA